MISSMQSQLNALDTGLNRLDTGIKEGNLTPQDVDGIIMEQTKALAQTASGATDTKFHAEQYDSWMQKFAKFRQESQGYLDTGAVPPAFINKIRSNFNQLENVIGQHRKEYASNLYNPALDKEGVDPKVSAAQLDALKQIDPNFSPQTRGQKPVSKGLINSNQNQPKALRQVSADEISAYASKHGLAPDAAKSFLKGQGYGVD